MNRRRSSAAVVLLGTLALSACSSSDLALPAGASSSSSSTAAAEEPAVEPSETSEDADPTPTGVPDGSGPASSKPASTRATSSATPSRTRTTSAHPSASTASGPRIVSFRVAQKPKCAEGTAVFRAKVVPLIIEWKITGATGGALSVDDNSGTPGTYGPVDLTGSEEFRFTCSGPVGSTESHTYAIYSVGGGARKVKTIRVSAKVLDKGLNPTTGNG
ncbi:hypothetical protein ACWKSP_14540 [Micromonosporaceae bacterium Da 78-11]